MIPLAINVARRATLPENAVLVGQVEAAAREVDQVVSVFEISFKQVAMKLSLIKELRLL